MGVCGGVGEATERSKSYIFPLNVILCTRFPFNIVCVYVMCVCVLYVGDSGEFC